MKIERINENQIQCTLTNYDLSVRNLNLGELAYGSEKARGLFREMIQKASTEVGFDAEDIPLMVEAIPLSSESVMLVITKVEDPEELDTRFAKFTPSSEEDEGSPLSSFTSEVLEGAREFLQTLPDRPQPDSSQKTVNPCSTPPASRVYVFDDLDRITMAAHAIGSLQSLPNTLYKNPDNRKFYLIVHNTDTTRLEFSRTCNILSEYGSKIHHEYSSEAYYQEHYELLIAERALQKLAQL